MTKRIIVEIILIVTLFGFIQRYSSNGLLAAIVIVGGAINIVLRLFGFFDVGNKEGQ